MYDKVKCFLNGEKQYSLSHEKYVDQEMNGGYQQTRLTFHHVEVITKPTLKAHKGEDVETDLYDLVIVLKDNARYTIYISPMYKESATLVTDYFQNLTKSQVMERLMKFSKSEIAFKILKEVG